MPPTNRILHVHVLPHSHCDPGWWYTFDEYYTKWVQGILISVLDSLERHPQQRFIWAEISFFQRHFDSLSQADQDRWRIHLNQLEFVTGGWVMHDEAVSEIRDMRLQLSEGAHWLAHSLNIKQVKSAWLIDPFGHGVSTSLLYETLKYEMGVLNRVHASVRDSWRQAKQLEFVWQPVPISQQRGLPVHVLPFGYYDIPSTCGPNRDVCETFEFEGPRGVWVTEENLASRADQLVQQYRQQFDWQSQQSRHMMVPLGDDFKYKTVEFTRHFLGDYQRLFDYINSNPKYNMQVYFSTIHNYTASVPQWPSEIKQQDLQTYTDRNEDYWTGYYTSRPHLKTRLRDTGRHLRTLQTLISLKMMRGDLNLLAGHIYDVFSEQPWKTTLPGSWPVHDPFGFANKKKSDGNELDVVMTECRRQIGLLQHHDAVTGTARAAVVKDYALQLQQCQTNIKQSISNLTKSKQIYLGPNDVASDELPLLELKHLNQIHSLQVLNILAHERDAVVSFHVHSIEFGVRIVTETEDEIPIQIEHRFDLKSCSSLTNQYRVIARVHLPALASLKLLVQAVPFNEKAVTKSQIFNAELVSNKESISLKESPLFLAPETLSLPSKNQTFHFNTSSFQLSHSESDGNRRLFEQEFRQYKTQSSGAYIFKPISSETLTIKKQCLIHTLGELQSSIISNGISPFDWQFLSTFQWSDALDVAYRINSQGKHQNVDYAVRFKTDLRDDGSLMRDANGWLPVTLQRGQHPQGHSVTVHEQDLKSLAWSVVPFVSRFSLTNGQQEQFTVMTRTSSGVVSLEQGHVEVFCDRVATADDGRGLGEPLLDSEIFTRRLRLIWNENLQDHSLSAWHDFDSDLMQLWDGADSPFESKVISKLSNSIHVEWTPCLTTPLRKPKSLESSDICVQFTNTGTEPVLVDTKSLDSGHYGAAIQCSHWDALPRGDDRIMKDTLLRIAPFGVETIRWAHQSQSYLPMDDVTDSYIRTQVGNEESPSIQVTLSLEKNNDWFTVSRFALLTFFVIATLVFRTLRKILGKRASAANASSEASFVRLLRGQKVKQSIE